MTDLGFTFGTAPARTRTGGPRQRSETQQAYDTLVKQLRDMWDEAGRPATSAEKPCAYIPVTDEEDHKEKEKFLRSAASFLDLSVRFYDAQQDAQGNWTIPVSAEDKRDYKPRKKTADSGE